MSLNGLDAALVSDAYYAAIVEVGGWFLLRYTNRDSVELLAKGKGGVHEARNELLKYEEKSPLYGLIIYRRRKVLIKFIPDGTSRLLQARTAVHFQAVAERYAPYETILEISNPDELSDTSLASSFPLHTASPALSTTRLDEISEDAEDGGGSASSPNKVPTRANSAKFGTARYKTERRVDQLMRAQQARPTSPLRSETASNLSASPPTGLKPSISQFLVREDSGTRSITSLTPSVASVTDYAGSIAESDVTTTKETDTIASTAELHKVETATTDREMDMTTTEPGVSVSTPSIHEPPIETSPEPTDRPVSIAGSDRSSQMPHLSEVKSVPDRPKTQIEEPFDFSYLEAKPKIKLGPRPVNTTERARKSGNMGTSLLPSGYLAKKQDQRPKSTGPLGQTHSQLLAGLATLPTPPPIPDVPEYNPRPISRGSVKSMPSQKSTTMTPEKLRLMKAVELRKRQMRKSNPQIKTSLPMDQVPEVPKIEQSAATQPAGEAALPPKPDSAIALEHDRRVIDKKPDTSEALAHTVQREDISEEPAGLLSKPTIAEEPASQQTESAINEETPIGATEMATEEEQSGGAEDLPLQSQDAPAPVEPQDATFAPASNFEPKQVEAAAAEVALPPSHIDAKHIEATAEESRALPAELNKVTTGSVDQNIDEATFSTSNENLITDVPAIVTTASSRPQTAEDDANANATVERSPSPFESGAPSSMESSGIIQFDEKETTDLAKRRRGLVEPLHIDVETRRNSEAGSLSDNDFLEELQSATFHNAKEMVVSKSPGPSASFFPPGFERSESADSRSRSPIKKISIPNGMSQIDGASIHQMDVSPELYQPKRSGKSSGSVSPIDRNSPVASLKRNVSSGITKRIQALNELSNREPSAVPVHIPTRALSPDPAPVFLANDRRPNMRSPHSRTGSSYRLRPSADRAGSFPNGTQAPEIPHVWNTSQDTTSNRDSVSVKARIVRPPTAGSIEKSADNTNDLHESQIEINHSRGVSTPTSVSQAFLPPMPAIPANPPSPDHRSLHSLRRKSFGRSKASTPGPTPANSEDVRSGAASIASTDESTGSRTSRFFKRMSNFGSTSSKRRSIINPVAPTAVASPPATETSASRSASVANTAPSTPAIDRDTPPAVQVGDLNVQFPDTLLWKRRWLSLSDTGHLLLSPTTTNQHNASQHVKKFHLSDFKAPYAPDLDQQELPHSICLEFTASASSQPDTADDGYAPGGVLQLACEDAMGQRQVLRLLGGYWKSWVV